MTSSLPSTEHTLTKDQAVAQLWQHGILYWKLDENQKGIYEEIMRSDAEHFVINMSRQTGKSFLLCLIAIEYAIRNPNVRICYASYHAKAVKKIIYPNIRKILQDCPEYLRPHFKTQDSSYVFPNGSVIDIAGTDNNRAESLRGQTMHLGVVDEAGFMDNADYVIKDILGPQTLTTRGKILISSTPPQSPAHDFVQIYLKGAKIDNAYAERSIYDCPRLTEQDVIRAMKKTDKGRKHTLDDYKKFYREKSGPNNTTWRREYMVEIVTDESNAVLPEFTEEKAKKLSVVIVPFREDKSTIQTDEWMRPLFYDRYVWMDIGGDDNTGILFGYWDFNRATLVIEDCMRLKNPSHRQIAEAIRNKEYELWNDAPIYKRVSDASTIDISQLIDFGLTNPPFVKPPRMPMAAGVNLLRTDIGNDQIRIHKRCSALIDEMRFGLWDNKRTDFQRNKETHNDYGHFDLLAALVYANRTVDRHRNPTPQGYGYNIYTQHVNIQRVKERQGLDGYKRLFPFNKRPK